jgi:PIN domain nuclease of toxin-antitoxin system
MRVLLDTHAFLWAIGQPGKLSKKAARIIADEENDLLLSAASLWEIALKVRAGKLRLPESREFLAEHMANLGVQCLPIGVDDVLGLFALPDHHRDPFDRLLIAQCQAQRVAILTADPEIRRYAVEAIW